MYMIWDLETENHEEYKRFANPFSDKNYVVARGWKLQGDAQCSYSYHPEKDGAFTHIPEGVRMLVGHNIKFDLLYEWDNPELKAFFRRGGVIWDTQYAEYLLQAQHPDYHMVALDTIVESYGGRKKINSVKALWEMGMLTSQIDRDLLIDYLIGTEEENRNSGDIGNTELIFLGQIKKAKAAGMLKMIQARMDGLLATTDMEYNGLKIDVEEGKRRMKVLEADLVAVDAELLDYIPVLPPELQFNWASNVHVSALVFGGTLKYDKPAPYMDANGEFVRKMETATAYSVGGEWIVDTEIPEGTPVEIYSSGKKKGTPKTKLVKVPGELKMRKTTFFVELPGYTAPDAKWKGSLTDAAGDPVYSTNAEVIEELGKRDIPFLKALSKRQDIVKDLGTYYLRYDTKKKDFVGMLTTVMRETHIIHHNLNHTKTVTTRLSSDKPNLQNIPSKGTSEVKKMFVSRFGEDGQVMEADYSQLEIIGQAVLCKDPNLCEDIRNRIDFHCKRVAAKFHITYDEAVDWCKNENHPDYANGALRRREVKEFSFQRAYGAGAAAIAESTGMTVDEVKDLIEAEEQMYPGVTVFNDSVEQSVKTSAVAFRDPVRGNRVYRRGYWQAPTGTMYSFRSYDAPAFLKEEGVEDTFKPTEMKNYPVQGTSGEIVQIILGKLWRHFISVNNYDGRAFLVNTVHDSVWLDTMREIMEQVAADVKRIMESVPEVLNELYGMEVDVPFPVEIEVGDNMYTKHVLHI